MIAPALPSLSAKRGLLQSLTFALDGIMRTLQTQRNMKIHWLAALCVSIFMLAVPFELNVRVMLYVCMALILTAEVFNSSLEAMVDLATDRYHPLAKTAKDAAAGGVLILSAAATVIFADVLGTHQDLLAQHQADLLHVGYIAVWIVLSETAGLFLRPRGYFGLARIAISLGLFALLLPRYMNPMPAAVILLLIWTTAHVSLSKPKP